jgi:hypothetical protein
LLSHFLTFHSFVSDPQLFYEALFNVRPGQFVSVVQLARRVATDKRQHVGNQPEGGIQQNHKI